MTERAGPLVSVLTPVYNGAAYLRECIESVRAQTWPTWEYVIADNHSTDGTRELAESYAARDPRIRVVTGDVTVSAIANHNRAFALMSPAAAYAKVVHADDWLFPECLTRMVEVAEAHPSVGVVGAYRLAGARVELEGLPRSSTVVAGRDICRAGLLGGPYVFGSPTSVLFRAALLRGRDAVYDESTIHADEVACYELLQRSDFGFVHQVLTYTRVHEASMTSSFARRMDSYHAGALLMLHRFGPPCLTPEEYAERRRLRLRNYYRCLARAALGRRDRAYWDYHRTLLARVDAPLSVRRVAGALLGAAVDRLARAASALTALAADRPGERRRAC